MSDGWIVIRNWEDHQHPDVLRTERPAWIKVKLSLLHDDDFLELTDRRRGLLFSLWLLYASASGRVAVNTARLSRLLSMRVTVADLEALNDAGFIVFSASKPASTRASRVASTEQKREEKKELASSTSPQERNGLPFEHELAATKLISAIGPTDVSRTRSTLEKYQLPPAAWHAAAEELDRMGAKVGNRAAYTVGLFKAWKNEGRYAKEAA